MRIKALQLEHWSGNASKLVLRKIICIGNLDILNPLCLQYFLDHLSSSVLVLDQILTCPCADRLSAKFCGLFAFFFFFLKSAESVLCLKLGRVHMCCNLSVIFIEKHLYMG